MSVTVIMPQLGESVTEGTVTRWLKAVGDTVVADEPLLEISTDKVDTEIPAPASGVLVAITAPDDAVVPVGSELGRIANSAAPAPAPAPAAPASGAEDASESYVTPLVRRLAAQHGVDLSRVTGTGVGGRIRKSDVLAAAGQGAPPAPAPAPAAPAAPPKPPTPIPVSTATAVPAAPSALRGRTEKMSRLRQIIAERMVESLQTSAQLTTVVEVDVTRINALRTRVKRDFEAREGVKLTFLPFFCKAAIEALKQFPQLNASIDMEARTVTYHDQENLGIAVDTERGLLVPVIRDAGDLSIAGLARKIADLAERTRTNKVSPEELSGGTFTMTNTGSRGALFDTPIINMPQVAILGTGSVVKRPIVTQDDAGQDVIAIRSMVYLVLSYDHRLVDGADAARFLSVIKARLESAEFDAELGL
jgi:2-oxoglutarate dehydrogenase E2 component (dihydrolipoamide succinyltransferase)